MSRDAAEIFHEARERRGAERSSYLDGACGKNAALRAKVEALLRADAEAGDFLALPAEGDPSLARAAAALQAERAGASIERYKLLEQIGEGGMGTIWLAEQREPVKRRVALKIIKLGMDTKQVIARFEAERQALALMDHPHIAKVFDAGTTETGRPYFVMEYIKGIPILEYCDKEKVDTKARLLLFTKVCQAIQHAHQKGIIHRDIKPSNVLVTLHDGVPVPKVIDFGIAKATNTELTAKTLFTEHQQIVGTPAYMSPEQAEMSGLDIDTRSDIYSLGVLLYELLTGLTPFDMRTLLKKGFAEMLRTIREDEPQKPSTRISTLGETGTKTAQQRQVDAKKLSSLLRGDIDWIVMKCLEKDRSRRYESANGLAADIQRHLHDEPVTAGAPSAGYVLRKYVKRHRGQVLAGSAVLAALVVGLVAFAWQAEVANDERDRAWRALADEAEQRRQSELARAEAETQQKRAEAHEAEAEKLALQAREQEAEAQQQAAIAEAVAKFQTDMLAAVDPNQLPRDPVTLEPLKDRVTVLQAMKAALDALDAGSLADLPKVEMGVRATIGRTLHRLGRYAEAERNLQRALGIGRSQLRADHPDLALLLGYLASCQQQQNRVAEAEALFREALAMQRAAPSVAPQSLAVSLDNLAILLSEQNRAAEAAPLFREALELRRSSLPAGDRRLAKGLQIFGVFLQTCGEQAEAEAILREALEIERAKSPAGHPSLAAVLDSLALVLREQKRYTEAEPLAREALESRRASYPEGHPLIAHSLNMLGTVLFGLQRLTEAEALLREALEILRAVHATGHPDIVEAASQLAILRNAQRDFAEAEALFREALEHAREAFPAGHPQIADCANGLAVLYWRQTLLEKAIPLLEEGLRLNDAARGRRHRATLSNIAYLGASYVRAGRIPEGLPLLEEVVAASAQHRELRGFALHLVEAYARTADPAEPETLARLSSLVEELVAEARTRFPARSPALADEMNKLLHPLLENDAWKAAAPLIEECVAIRRAALPAGDPATAAALNNLAMLRIRQEKLDEAETLLREVLEIDRAAQPAGHPSLGTDASNLAALLVQREKFADAEVLLSESLAALRAALPAGHRILQTLASQLAEVYAKQGRTEPARAMIRELVEGSRATLPKESAALAGELVRHGRTLLELQAWDEAEPLLRESLAIREQLQPEQWTTFNTRSLLGAVLLGQQKLAEAEPLLLAGYRGLKEREGSFATQAATRLAEALERLVRLYEALDRTSEAARWRSELEAARAKAPHPAANQAR